MANKTIAGTGGTSNALFLKVFSGEVLAAFQERNVMMDLHTVRTIQSGKSAQFPMTGTGTAEYHTPGNEINGSAITHNEQVINIDQMLVASAFIPNIDEAMNHYDVRSIYAKELGYALANHADKAVIRSGLAGSLDLTDPMGVTVSASDKTITKALSGCNVTDAILQASENLDARDIPAGDRYAVLTPGAFYTVLKAAGGSNTSAAVLNTDYGQGGSVLSGGSQTLLVGGIQCFMSNHIPTGDEGTATGELGDGTGTNNDPFLNAGATGAGAGEGYSGIDFSNYYGLVFHRSGIGTVKLLDLAIESDYLVQNQGTLMVAKYAMGHNWLRSHACIGIKSA